MRSVAVVTAVGCVQSSSGFHTVGENGGRRQEWRRHSIGGGGDGSISGGGGGSGGGSIDGGGSGGVSRVCPETAAVAVASLCSMLAMSAVGAVWVQCQRQLRAVVRCWHCVAAAVQAAVLVKIDWRA